MKIVFMGTPSFATPALQRLIDSPHHEVTAVVTQPDRPAGRSKVPQFSAVKELALKHNLVVLQPEKIRGSDFAEVLRFYQPDLIVVVAYGQLLPKALLEIPRFGCINIHGSLLPKYRGAAPVQWAIARGERTTGVTIMQLDVGMDTGPIIAQDQVEILPDDDTISVANMLSVLGAELMMKVISKIDAEQTVVSTPQDDNEATYAPILQKADGLVDWGSRTEEIICRINGFQPWPAAFSFLQRKLWKFLRAEPFELPDERYFAELEREGDIDPGTVCSLERGRGFTVKTGDGFLLVTAAQPEGRKAMSGVDIINGGGISAGQYFISDAAFLNASSSDS